MIADTQELYENVKTALRSDDPSALSGALAHTHAADIAEVYEVLDDEDRSRLFFALPPSTAAGVVVLLEEADRGEIVDGLDRTALAKLVSGMTPDDAADVLGELPHEQRKATLERLSRRQGKEVAGLLEYDEDTAGGIMTTSLVAMPAEAAVRDAVQKLRTALPGEDIHYVYVTNHGGRLTGIVSLRQLLLNDLDTRLGAICSPDPITVHVDDDQEEVIHVISKYDVAALPVVDRDGRLLGQITHDDVMDVYEEEADEDMYRMAGLDAAEFERASIMRAAGIRLSWLLPCLASMAVAAGIMALAQQWFDQLAIYAALIVFVPMIGAIGGNSGIQISTIIIRGLATGDLAASRFPAALSREGRIALVMAPVCGVTAWAICRLGLPVMQRINQASLDGIGGSDPLSVGGSINRIAFSVGLGMACAILVAAALGMVLPFLFRHIRVDPAIAAGPIVTTVNDVISVTVFLGMASIIMTG